MSAPAPAKELTLEELDRFCKEFDIKLSTATTFTPNFKEDVYVTPPPVQVSPNYCATVKTAMDLMNILRNLQPVGYLDWPSQFSGGSPFYYTAKVPWLTFSNGAVRNAGQLAYYWKANSGDPGGKTAEKNARMDIAWG